MPTSNVQAKPTETDDRAGYFTTGGGQRFSITPDGAGAAFPLVVLPDNDVSRSIVVTGEGPVSVGRFRMLRVEGCVPGSKWKVTLLTGAQRVERMPAHAPGLVELFNVNLFDQMLPNMFYLPNGPDQTDQTPGLYDLSGYRGVLAVLKLKGISSVTNGGVRLNAHMMATPIYPLPSWGPDADPFEAYELDRVSTPAAYQGDNDGAVCAALLVMPGVKDGVSSYRRTYPDVWPWVAFSITCEGGSVLVGDEPSYVAAYGVR